MAAFIMLFCYTRIYKRTAKYTKYAKWFNSVYSQILTLLTLLLLKFPYSATLSRTLCDSCSIFRYFTPRRSKSEARRGPRKGTRSASAKVRPPQARRMAAYKAVAKRIRGSSSQAIGIS